MGSLTTGKMAAAAFNVLMLVPALTFLLPTGASGSEDASPLADPTCDADGGDTAGAATASLNLCEWRPNASTGVVCECEGSRALCALTRPLCSSALRQPAGNQLVQPSAEEAADAVKSRRHTPTVDSLVLESSLNESFLNAFPRRILEEPLHLKSIRIVHAKLGQLNSNAIHGSRHVQRLVLRACGLTKLWPGAISGLQNLFHLDLSDNELPYLTPGALKDLPSLRVLVIARSGLKVVDTYALADLQSLENLTLKDNDIGSIGRHTLAGLGNLRAVDLSYNRLQRLPNGAFESLTRLRELSLAGNRLATLEPKAFRGLVALERLSLDHNALRRLPDAFLAACAALSELDLGHNRLTAVGLDALRGLRFLRTDFVLRLRANPLNCSCDLFYLTELRKRRLASQDDPSYEPPELEHLQCRKVVGGFMEPTTMDEFFAHEPCQEDPALADHIPEPLVSPSTPSSADTATNGIFVVFVSLLVSLRFS